MAPLLTTEDPMIEARSYTPQDTGYMRQHNPSPYSTFDEPSATPPLKDLSETQDDFTPALGRGDTYTTTTTWSFPGDEPDITSSYPGMDEMMGLGSADAKFQYKEAKLRAKEEQHRQKLEQDRQRYAIE